AHFLQTPHPVIAHLFCVGQSDRHDPAIGCTRPEHIPMPDTWRLARKDSRYHVERKRGTMDSMNPQKATIVILATLLVSLALAEDLKTVSGKIYKDVTISCVEADGIVLRTKTGITKVYFAELPKDVQERFRYG